MKKLIMFIMILAIAFLFTGCGGGGGGGGGSSSDIPVLSNLIYSPTSTTFRSGGGTTTVSVSVDFSDSGGNLSTLSASVYDSTGRLIDSITDPFLDAQGITSDTILIWADIDTTAVGKFTFQIYVTDTNGSSSNVLSGVFEIKVDDSGTQWTQRTSGVIDFLNGIVWSGGQFVVVGNNGVILTSPDGVDWTQKSSVNSSALYSVVWSGAQYVIVGENGTILTSPDGQTWTQRFSGFPLATIYDVVWTGTQFVAVGDASTMEGIILTSPDGINWTQRTSPVGINLRSIAYSGSLLVAGGFDNQNSSGTLLISPDGINWSSKSIASPSYGIADVTWTGSKFVAVGPLGRLFTSTTGDIWQEILSLGLSNPVYSVTFSGNNYIAGNQIGIFTATDLSNWTWQMNASPTNAIYGTIWVDSLYQYVAVGANGTILTSP